MDDELLFNVMHRINTDVFTFFKDKTRKEHLECQVAHFWMLAFDLWTIQRSKSFWNPEHHQHFIICSLAHCQHFLIFIKICL